MALTFPDPNQEPVYKAPNGITYSWDADDEKWVIGSFAAEDVIGDCASSSNTICDQLTELEEEIEALAPSVERGVWTMNLLGTVAQQGQMSLYDDDYTNVGNPTGLFTAVKSIWLNEIDNSGTPHGFAGVEAGEMVELFVQGQPEYGLYEVIDVHDETNGAAQWWVIEVSFVRTLETTSTVDNGDLVRVKIFQAPTGADPGTFLLKYGDKIEDASGPVYYEWNNNVRMESSTGAFGIKAVTTAAFEVNAFYAYSPSGVEFDTNLFNIKKANVNNNYLLAVSDTQITTSLECTDASVDAHVVHKGYLDSKIQELLDRIAELEMSGGGTNYRFEFKTRSPFTSGEPGSGMDARQIFSQSKLYSNNDSWYVTTGNETSGLGGENGWVYVCFDSDEWAMNSTGSLHSVQKNPNNSADTFNRDSKVFNLAISNAEKCPDEYSNGKNIWRFETVPILYKNRDYEGQYLSHYENDMDIYVTFAGGSLVKTSTP